MKKIRIGDLRAFMESQNLSAEMVADKIPLSNMTIRRLLKMPDSRVISDKYQLHLSHLIQSPVGHSNIQEKLATIGNGDMIDQLIEDAKNQDAKKVKKDLDKKLKEDSSWSQTILDSVKTLNKIAFGKSHPKAKMIALGALIYFVNPFDLIPDSIPVIGYLDDIGVMALAIHQIHKIVAEEASKAEA